MVEFVDLWITILNEMIPALPEDIITNQVNILFMLHKN